MQHLQPKFLWSCHYLQSWSWWCGYLISFTGPLTVRREAPCPSRSNGLPCKHQRDSSHVSQSLQDVTTIPTASLKLGHLPRSPLIPVCLEPLHSQRSLSLALCCAMLRLRVATILAHSHMPTPVWLSFWSVSLPAHLFHHRCPGCLPSPNTSNIADCKSFAAF